jgi:hypothetical protein
MADIPFSRFYLNPVFHKMDVVFSNRPRFQIFNFLSQETNKYCFYQTYFGNKTYRQQQASGLN